MNSITPPAKNAVLIDFKWMFPSVEYLLPGLRSKQVLVTTEKRSGDDKIKSWTVLPPRCVTPYAHESKYAKVTVTDAPEGLTPLDADQWARLQLALRGIEDKSWSASSVRTYCRDEHPHFWAGLMPTHGITLLAGEPKAGKSSLLRGLFRAARDADTAIAASAEAEAERPFLGRAVSAFRSFVLSEEPRQCWRGVADGVRILSLDEPPIRSPKEWTAFISGISEIVLEYEYEVVVLDTYSRACAADENSAKATTKAIAALRSLTVCDLTVLLVHHTGRSGHVRGSTALEANVDSVLKIDRVSDDEADPRRVLTCVNRLAPASRIEYHLATDGSLVAGHPPQRGGKATVSQPEAGSPWALPAPPRRG